MKYTLTVQGRLDGLNDYTLACRRNKFAGNTMKRKNEAIISEAIFEQIRDVHITKPVIIHYNWIEPTKRRDLDNIAFAKKFFQDALVKNGILDGDTHDYIKGFTDNFFYDKENPRIEVVIEEIT